VPRPIRRPVLVVTAVNAFGWVANMLYVGYLLVDLHAGPARYGLALALWGGAGLVSGWLLGRVRLSALERLAAPCLLAMAAAWALMTRPLGYWPVALLGLPEGFVTWLLFDLLQARVLELAPAARRGAWTAVAASWGAGGRLVGLASVLVLPVFTRVHVGFGLLAALMTAAAVAVGLSAGVPTPAAAEPPPPAGVTELRPNESA
jgi:predicted MFS family arabinose efflux permease